MLIPTRWRSKLSQDLAHPIGAQAISAALAGVAQYDDLSTRFSAAGPRERGNGFVEVVQATFVNLDYGLGLKSGGEGHLGSMAPWSLAIDAVRRQDKAAVRDALTREGLPRIRAWLAAPRVERWYYGLRSFHVSVRPSDGAVRSWESGDTA